MFKRLGVSGWIYFILHVIGLILLVLSSFSSYISPGSYWFVALLGVGHVLILAVNLVLTAGWLFFKPAMSLLFLCLIGLLTPFHRKVISIRFSSSPQINNSIKIMSYNVQLFKLYNWTHNKELRDEIMDYIGQEKPDILCMQEYFEADGDYFETTEPLRMRLSGGDIHFAKGVTNHKGHEFGISTYTTLPIVGKGSLHFEHQLTKTNLAQYTDLLWEGDTIRVFNVHLASNHLKTDEMDQIIEAGNESWMITRKWLRKLRNGYRNREVQVKILRNEIDKSPHPVIVCGDVNDVPVSYTYRILSAGLIDAFLETGSWIGATYNGRFPFLRIDYIFHSPSLKSTNFKVAKQNFTDHFPIHCEMGVIK